MTAILSPGFAEPALDAQRCFRAVLEAMSRPGRVQRLDGIALHPPAPLGRAAAAVLLSLADADTPVWLDEVAAPAAGWLRFHAGCPLIEAPGAATFAMLAGTGLLPLDRFAAGTEEAPQDSATVLIEVEALHEGPGGWTLSGPGIETTHGLVVAGLPADFTRHWAANHARFPRGVDVILCAGDRLAALPRSLRITTAEGTG